MVARVPTLKTSADELGALVDYYARRADAAGSGPALSSIVRSLGALWERLGSEPGVSEGHRR